MYYNIHFSSTAHGSVDHDGTHRLTEFPQAENTISWRILDTPAAQAFIASTNLILNNTEHSDISPRRFIDWNRYGKHVSWDSWCADAVSINQELKYCADNDFIQFDSSYHISEQLDEQERISRLNRIHYAFEKELENRQTQLTATAEFLASLERLNKLVHSLEKPPGSSFGESFYVIRHSSDYVRDQFVPITDEMYQCFEENTLDGDLYSDFFTVGKDLGHAFHTNDVELVRNREVKQQSVISGSVAFGVDVHNFGIKQPHRERERYQQWCVQNDVGKYYDHTLPKYNLGRAPVGSLDMTYDELTHILNQTPYVVGIELSE
jgi:hypothetical protein